MLRRRVGRRGGRLFHRVRWRWDGKTFSLSVKSEPSKVRDTSQGENF